MADQLQNTAATPTTTNTPSVEVASQNNSQTEAKPLVTKAKEKVPIIKKVKAPPTATEVQKQTSNIIKTGFVVSTILILTTGVLLFLTNGKVKQITQIKQQIVSKNNDDKNLQGTVEFIEANEQLIDPIIQALPDENTLVDFISTVEAIADGNSSNSSLEFSAIAPTTSGQDKFIPFVIDLETDRVNFEEFLKQIEKLPYIVQVYSIEANIKNPELEIWEYSVAARIYVRDPFKT